MDLATGAISNCFMGSPTLNRVLNYPKLKGSEWD